MEEDVLPSPAVAGYLSRNYIEARLHTDGKVNLERIKELQAALAGNVATPYYVLIKPETGEKVGEFPRATFDKREFLRFLKEPFETKVSSAKR